MEGIQRSVMELKKHVNVEYPKLVQTVTQLETDRDMLKEEA
jgi:hypothetical protein